jgi:hypothetical protein
MKQKKFSIILISCLLLTSLLLSGTAYAQDEELPDPGITPDSPFYFFDTLGKNIGLFFAFGPEAKARKALQYAEERLAEAQVMAAKNRVREMTRAANDYDGFMAMVNERAEEARQQGVSDNISEKVALATSKHLSVLDRIKDKLPKGAKEDIAGASEEARGAIVRARGASQNGQIDALQALAKIKPERAIDIASDTIEKRLERARAKATENVTTENVTTDVAEVAEALDYAARIAEIEEEMVAIAEEKGIDITAIQQRLAQSTSNRLEVLSGAYEKVPEQAKPAIENAIENSVRKYERAVEKLKENNALSGITEEVPALQRIQEEVKEKLKLRTSTQAQVSDDTTEQARIQTQVQVTVKEQTSNLKSVKPEPTASANKTREDTVTEKVPK